MSDDPTKTESTSEDDGNSDPSKPDPKYVTKEELDSRFSRLEEKISGLLGKPEGSPKPNKTDEEEGQRQSRIAAAEERARKMVEEAARKILAEQPKEEKKEEKKEEEKSPVKPRRLTKFLWGGE